MKIRIKFSKQGNMKFIGHLDIMRYFQKAMRRADVNIRYSEGFSPHQIMSFAAPLGVGLTGSGEYLDIDVLSSDASKEMVRRLNDTMVEGMEVLSFRKLPDDAANAMSLVAAADYTVRLRDGWGEKLSVDGKKFFSALSEFLETGDLNIVKKTKKGQRTMDLKPLIYEHRLLEDGNAIFLKLSSGSTDNVKPELVLEAFLKSLKPEEEYPSIAFLINREELYAKMDGNGKAAVQGAESEKDGGGTCRYVSLEEFGEDIE